MLLTWQPPLMMNMRKLLKPSGMIWCTASMDRMSKNLIRYIPNTADGCCLERELPERINLVFLNTGAAYGLEIFDNTEPIESQRERQHNDYLWI